MRMSDVALAVINKLITQEELKRLAEVLNNNRTNQTEISVPDSIPQEIEAPIIGDIYGNNGINTENCLILGSYTPMQSPGVITFYLDNITQYTGSLIRKMVNCGEEYSLGLIISMTANVLADVTLHESFHYYCDYKRSLTGARYDRDKEEALAVAHSYNIIGEIILSKFRPKYLYEEFRRFETEIFRAFDICPGIPLTVIKTEDIFRNIHYKSYTLKGYRDWHLYINKNSYETDFYDYIKDSRLDKLLKNGVPVNDIRGELMIIGHKGTKIVVK